MEKLALERKRSEDLLYRMMPKAIADRLTLGGKAVETCEVCCIGEGCVTKINQNSNSGNPRQVKWKIIYRFSQG